MAIRQTTKNSNCLMAIAFLSTQNKGAEFHLKQ